MTIQYDPLAGQRPAPVKLNYNKPFWDAANEGKLMLQYCKDTNKYQFYPRPVSIYSGSRNLEWRESTGKGRVYTFSISHKAPPPFKITEPYVVATIELEEGVRVLTNIINCDPSKVEIDMPVRLAWVKAGEDNYPVFEPA